MEQNSYEPDLISLIDDDGVEYRFEILDVIEENGKTYYALAPLFDDPEKQVQSEGEYYIMEQTMEDDEPFLTEIHDEALAERLAEVFEQHFEELFADEYDESEE